MTNASVALCALLLPGFIAAAAEGQWAQFRGPNGSGVDSAESRGRVGGAGR